MYLFLFKSNVGPRQSKYKMEIALDLLVSTHKMQKKKKKSKFYDTFRNYTFMQF